MGGFTKVAIHSIHTFNFIILLYFFKTKLNTYSQLYNYICTNLFNRYSQYYLTICYTYIYKIYVIVIYI